MESTSIADLRDIQFLKLPAGDGNRIARFDLVKLGSSAPAVFQHGISRAGIRELTQ